MTVESRRRSRQKCVCVYSGRPIIASENSYQVMMLIPSGSSVPCLLCSYVYVARDESLGNMTSSVFNLPQVLCFHGWIFSL